MANKRTKRYLFRKLLATLLTLTVVAAIIGGSLVLSEMKRMIENCDVIPLDENVKRQAIKIRRTYGIQNPTSTGLPHDYTKTRNAKRKGTSLEHQSKVFVRDDKILSGRDG